MLTKKDKKKRYNKKTHSLKGHEFSAISKNMTSMTQDAFKGSNFGGAVGGLVSAATGAIDAGMKNAELVGVEEAQEAIDTRQNFQSTANTNNDLLAEMAAATNAKSDYTHKDFMQDGKTLAMNTINATMQGAASGARAGPWGAVAGAAAGLLGGIGGIIGGRVKAGVEAAEKSEAAKRANEAQAQTLTAKAGALDQAADSRALAAYAAYGGGINAPKFSDFPSEVTEFNTGGSHEENPYDGIPQGIAPDGLPNLVEEGEVKFDNYIFSDRLMLNKNDKKKYKFLKGKTYADAAKAIKKELGVDERPNDLIAKTDLEEHLNILSTLQEEERAKRGLRGENRMMYKKGGHLFPGDEDAISNAEWDEEVASMEAEGFNPKKNSFDWSSLGQAMPAIGNVVGLFSNLSDKPKYEHTKPLLETEKSISPITFTPSLQRVQYKPTDIKPLLNRVMAQSAANRAAIAQQNATNPHTVTLGLLANDYSTNNQLGDIFLKASAQDDDKKMKTIAANNQVALAEEEGIMKAASANATLRDKALTRQAEKQLMAARLNMAEDQAWDAANSANLTGLFDNLGAMGKEKRSTILALAEILGNGKMTPEMYQQYVQIIPELKSLYGAHGGKIKTKKKKGYTI